MVNSSTIDIDVGSGWAEIHPATSTENNSNNRCIKMLKTIATRTGVN
ncbi:MAG TPA: hypothetical protein VE089_04100 [Nitrososphaeraceae archaeon]|nr:hypothetical protein [Nitrososphaeraceae archaeon]